MFTSARNKHMTPPPDGIGIRRFYIFRAFFKRSTSNSPLNPLKHFLSAFAIAFALFAAMPMTASAQNTCEIVSTGTRYNNLADAIAAIPTGSATQTVIRLLGNITHQNGVYINNKKNHL